MTSLRDMAAAAAADPEWAEIRSAFARGRRAATGLPDLDQGLGDAVSAGATGVVDALEGAPMLLVLPAEPNPGPDAWDVLLDALLVAALSPAGAGAAVVDEPICPGPRCPMCNGAMCDYCGAGCWDNRIRTGADRCEHATDERHRRGPPPRGRAGGA